MSSVTFTTQWSQMKSAGSGISIVCGPLRVAVWTKTPSASTGRAGAGSMMVVPQGVEPTVTGGSSGSEAMFWAIAMR